MRCDCGTTAKKIVMHSFYYHYCPKCRTEVMDKDNLPKKRYSTTKVLRDDLSKEEADRVMYLGGRMRLLPTGWTPADMILDATGPREKIRLASNPSQEYYPEDLTEVVWSVKDE